MLYQIRTLNKKRFQHKIGRIRKLELRFIRERLESLLELEQNHHSINMEIEGDTPKVDILYEEWVKNANYE